MQEQIIVDVFHPKMNLRLSERTLRQMNLLYRETSRFEPRWYALRIHRNLGGS